MGSFGQLSSLLAISFWLLTSISPNGVCLAAPAESRPPTKSLDWRPCPAPTPSGVSCAKLPVPIDWTKPDGPKVTLALNKIAAGNPKKRIGSLLFNPGGPGGPTAQVVAQFGPQGGLFSKSIWEHFDVIGMDPRGVAASEGIKCDHTLFNKRVSLFPTDEDSFNKMVEHWTAFGESCLEKTGPLLKHMDTRSTARDIDAVRKALGEAKLTFVGFSYGLEDLKAESLSYEQTLERFFIWASENPKSPLKGQNVARLFDEIVKRADEKPLPAPGCGEECQPDVTGEEIRFNLQQFVKYKDPSPPRETWIDGAKYLATTFKGDGSDISTLKAHKDSEDIFWSHAVQCSDWKHVDTLDTIRERTKVMKRLSAHTQGASVAWTIQTSCIGWPVPVANPEHKINVKNAPPTLLVNSYFDPVTPYSYAQGLQEQIEGSVLLTRNGVGHSSYPLEGEARQLMDTFLLNGTLPEVNTIVNS
ncbi:MAG: hypothetical protein M1831_003482 [Alyxoria varia]|nr:MAG: hypothetical protein M1831_003482 [Alyxoria varia]